MTMTCIEYTGCFAVILSLLFLLVRTTLIVATVESKSMSPTLVHGDRVLILRYWPRGWLRRGHIVLVYPWPAIRGKETTGTVPFIKRVVGLPGDTLVTSIKDLDQFHQASELAAHDSDGNRTWQIPPGHLFVRGDYPIGGWDSLSWGPVSFSCVLGLMVMKLPPKAGSIPVKRTDLQVALQPGQPAPDFIAETLAGEKVSLSTYEGRPVAFLFVAPNRHCREAMPDYTEAYAKARNAGVEIVLVSTAGAEQTRAFVDEMGITMPVLVAPFESNSFMKDYKVTATPRFCLVDAAGNVQAAGYPSTEWGSWKKLIDAWTVVTT
jgi:signal peptidase I